MSIVVLYCWCCSDSASVLLYFIPTDWRKNVCIYSRRWQCLARRYHSVASRGATGPSRGVAVRSGWRGRCWAASKCLTHLWSITTVDPPSANGAANYSRACFDRACNAKVRMSSVRFVKHFDFLARLHFSAEELLLYPVYLNVTEPHCCMSIDPLSKWKHVLFVN